jgi:hypothetical protein
MANWKWTLDIKDDWEAVERDEITTYELGQRIAAKLKNTPAFCEPQPWIERFKDLPEDVSEDQFDILLERFYDWADAVRIWVKPF